MMIQLGATKRDLPMFSGLSSLGLSLPSGHPISHSGNKPLICSVVGLGLTHRWKLGPLPFMALSASSVSVISHT